MKHGKLIEVALPLDAVNQTSARAVIFAQMVDDPSEYVDSLLSDPAKKRAAEHERKRRLEEYAVQQYPLQAQAIPQPPLEGVIAEIERERLFRILEDLVRWENSTNEAVLERARAEIR